MATYFSGNAADIQSTDGLQTLYLMNPAYVGFPEAGVTGNVVLINQHAGNPLPGSQQQFIGIPLPATAQTFIGNQPSEVNSDFITSNLRQHNHVWRNGGSEFSFVQPIDQANPTATNSSGNPFQISAITNSSGHQPIPAQLGLHREQQGGLSRSLSSSPVQFMANSNSFGSETAMAAAATIVPPGAAAIGDEGDEGEKRRKNWEGGVQGILLGSKYLKAAQELLEEVVNVLEGLKTVARGKSTAEDYKKTKSEPFTAVDSEDGAMAKIESELTAAEMQDVQMKKVKLVTMLEEVDQRYKQYRHQMQIVVSSFEAAAGVAAAKTYTALALLTISKQFRCLRDAIAGQIRITSRSLGEEDCIGSSKVEASRLRHVDQQLRQQRALQQLGVMQNNEWRQQRGLPERAVSVLRAWLFEHFLHPYPKDADKHILAKQTGLTRSQVSNWFINARVRLWKPMVEEMYMEETKEHTNTTNSEDKTSMSEINEDSAAIKSMEIPPVAPSKENLPGTGIWTQDNPTEARASPPSISTSSMPTSSLGNLTTQPGFGLIGSSPTPNSLSPFLDSESLKHVTPRRITNNGLQYFSPIPSIKVGVDHHIKAQPADLTGLGTSHRHRLHGYGFSTAEYHGGSFSSYQMGGDIGRYCQDTFTPRVTTSGVSLTLGLPHCDSVLSLSRAQSPYLSSPNMQLGGRNELDSEPTSEFCSLNPAAAHSAIAIGNINTQSRKRFASQLLPDSVTL